MPDFYDQAFFFFKAPEQWDTEAVKLKWDETKKGFFIAFIEKLTEIAQWELSVIETAFKEMATEKNIKAGELQMILRVMLVGSKMGPGVMIIAENIGKEATINRIKKAAEIFG